jgi:SAM-dependent methyltransferase
MAIQCPRCGWQYDVTLFEFGRTVRCDCGELLDLAKGHLDSPAARALPAPITPPTREYIESPHIALEYESYHRFNELFQYDTEVLARWFPTPGRLLDLGCGTGRHVVHFAAKAFEAVGVDLSEFMLRVARQNLDEAGAEATLVRGDITKLPELGLGRFRYVLCMFSVLGMIYGRANRIRFLADVCDHLGPGGRFALHVHNRWFNLWTAEGREYLRHALGNWLKRRPEPFQKMVDGYCGIRLMSLYVYSARELRQDLARAGLAIEQFLYLNRRRNGTLRGPCRGLRANGFLVLCRRADHGDEAWGTGSGSQVPGSGC